MSGRRSICEGVAAPAGEQLVKLTLFVSSHILRLSAVSC